MQLTLVCYAPQNQRTSPRRRVTEIPGTPALNFILGLFQCKNCLLVLLKSSIILVDEIFMISLLLHNKACSLMSAAELRDRTQNLQVQVATTHLPSFVTYEQFLTLSHHFYYQHHSYQLQWVKALKRRCTHTHCIRKYKYPAICCH